MLGKSIQIVTAAQHRLLQHRSRIPGVEDLFRRATLLREEEEEEEGLFKANAVQSICRHASAQSSACMCQHSAARARLPRQAHHGAR
jgi:hypothetical protein